MYTVDNVPDYLKKQTRGVRARWATIWNSVRNRCSKSGGDDKECEERAFKIANGVIKQGGEKAAGPWYCFDCVLMGHEDELPADLPTCPHCHSVRPGD